MANWSEYIQSRPVTTIPDRPQRQPIKWPAWLTDWESWLTFALVLIVFLSVAHSIDNANWVSRMPSLMGLSFIALCTGLALSRVRAPEVVLHLFALVIGGAAVFWLTLRFIDAPTLGASITAFKDRWGAWIQVVRNNDPTTDTMPFVMLVLALTWITAYLASWSIFRWRNAWLALVPGGIGLLTNISYLPGQFSADFVIFMFGAMLLVMRVHMANKIREWQHTDTPYPEFLSLRLLNITTWVALTAMLFAWNLPQANEVGWIARTWDRVAGPFSGENDTFVRLFSSIDAKREVPLHSFGDTLPLQGRVVLGSRIDAQVEFGEGSNLNRPLRVATYDTYTHAGWKAGSRSDVDLGPTEQVQGTNQKAQYKDRQEIQANFVMESGFPKNSLPTVGQPSQVSVNSRAEVISPDPVPDISAVRSRQKFKVGDAFVTTGSVSTAPEDKLRAAGGNYPAYISERYLQLPDDMPQRVRQLSADLTKDRAAAYDKAKAIEQYLRTFTPTFDVRAVPPGRDAVDFFLFDEKKGYFDYQASAMVVLLRAAGVPARLAVGFVVDEFDLTVRRYLIRDKHAYAWPEVYFPGYGWVEFAPYGDAPVINRPASDNAQGDISGPEDDTIKNGPGLDFGDIDEGAGITNPQLPSGSGSSPLKVLLPVLYGLLGLVALVGVAGIGVKLAWERGMGGLDYPSQLWEKTVRLASWLRLGPKPYQTPVEFGRSLRKALPDATEGVEVVAENYQRARYGRRDLTPAEREQLDEAWTPLRNRLIKRVLRWK